MKRRRPAAFLGHMPWRPLLPAALVAALAFSLELTILAGRSGAWGASFAIAIGTLVAWGVTRGADRAAAEFVMQLGGTGSANVALGPRGAMLLLVALVLDNLAHALGLAALPPGAPIEAGGPARGDALMLGIAAFFATRVLAQLATLRRGDAPQLELRDHLFALPGLLASVAFAACALTGAAAEPWSAWPFELAAIAGLAIADFALRRKHGTDAFAVLRES